MLPPCHTQAPRYRAPACGLRLLCVVSIRKTCAFGSGSGGVLKGEVQGGAPQPHGRGPLSCPPGRPWRGEVAGWQDRDEAAGRLPAPVLGGPVRPHLRGGNPACRVAPYRYRPGPASCLSHLVGTSRIRKAHYGVKSLPWTGKRACLISHPPSRARRACRTGTSRLHGASGATGATTPETPLGAPQTRHSSRP